MPEREHSCLAAHVHGSARVCVCTAVHAHVARTTARTHLHVPTWLHARVPPPHASSAALTRLPQRLTLKWWKYLRPLEVKLGPLANAVLAASAEKS